MKGKKTAIDNSIAYFMDRSAHAHGVNGKGLWENAFSAHIHLFNGQTFTLKFFHLVFACLMIDASLQFVNARLRLCVCVCASRDIGFDNNDCFAYKMHSMLMTMKNCGKC